MRKEADISNGYLKTPVIPLLIYCSITGCKTPASRMGKDRKY